MSEDLDEWVDENNPVHVVEVFVDALALSALSLGGAMPARTCRLAYRPPVLLKRYIYGSLDREHLLRHGLDFMPYKDY